jgi:tetratricopeptide (TPR) repeat protein
MAYARLGNAYFETNQLVLGREAVRKAYELRDRVSERERLYIESHYYEDVSGELDKAVPAFQLWQETYPDDPIPYVNLGADYTSLGRHDLALEQDRKALQMEPTLGLVYSNLALEYASIEDYQRASQVLEQAQQRKLQYSTLIGAAYQLAFLRGDQAEMDRQVQRGMGHPWTEAWLLALQADTEAYYGRRSRAEQFTRRAVESARRHDDHETAVGYELMDALRDAEYGYPMRARSTASQALAADNGQQTLVLSALALARAGMTDKATAITHELERRFPTDTLLINYWLPTIRAAVALSDHLPSTALDSLQLSAPYELAAPKTPTTAALYPVYLRGLALLAMGNAEAAQREFQKLLDHRGLTQNYFLHPLAQLQSARAYAMLAQKNSIQTGASLPEALDRAGEAYQNFFTTWQHADGDIPILRQARIEWQEANARTAKPRLEGALSLTKTTARPAAGAVVTVH